MRVVVSKKTIDPLTGSDVVSKRTIFVSENDPYNSIIYHKLADMLGIDRYNRTDHELARKVAFIYNYYSRLKGEDKAVTFIDNIKHKLNLSWRDAVDTLYRDARLKGLEEAEILKAKDRDKGLKNINKDFKEDSKRKEEIISLDKKQDISINRGIKNSLQGEYEALKRYQRDTRDKDKMKEIPEQKFKNKVEEV